MPWLLIGKLAKTYWSQIALGLLVLGLAVSLGVTRHTLSIRTQTLHNTEQAYANFQKEVKVKTDAAELADKQHADAIHQQDEDIRIKGEDLLKDKLAAADRDAAAYATKLRNQASGNPRPIGSQGSGSVANSSGSAPTASGTSVVDVPGNDARVCAENTVKAEQWRDWYLKAQAVPNRQ